MIVVVEEEEDVWVWVSEVQGGERKGWRKGGVKKAAGCLFFARRFFSVLV
jgi:hypothetical protein